MREWLSVQGHFRCLCRVSSQALAGLVAAAQWASRVTVFPGSHPAQPGMDTSAQRKACDPARPLQSQPSCSKKNMEIWTLAIYVPFAFPLPCLYFRIWQFRDPMPFIVILIIRGRGKIWLCLNLEFSSKLNWWWLFLQEI